MTQTDAAGQIVILNGPPRSGKSSIATVIQDSFAGVWMNLGVDRCMQMTPARYQPGIGLRPGGERQDLEPLVSRLYHAMYGSIAAHSQEGLNVVVDVGHHDAYAVPRGILPRCARRLSGLPVLFVGVHCPIEIIMQRRRDTGWNVGWSADAEVPAPIRLWQQVVHSPGIYRSGNRHIGAQPRSMCERDSPTPRSRAARIGLPATGAARNTPRLNTYQQDYSRYERERRCMLIATIAAAGRTTVSLPDEPRPECNAA